MPCGHTWTSNRGGRRARRCYYRGVDHDIGAGAKVAEPLLDGGVPPAGRRPLAREFRHLFERREPAVARELGFVIAVVLRRVIIGDLFGGTEPLVQIRENAKVASSQILNPLACRAGGLHKRRQAVARRGCQPGDLTIEGGRRRLGRWKSLHLREHQLTIDQLPHAGADGVGSGWSADHAKPEGGTHIRERDRDTVHARDHPIDQVLCGGRRGHDK
jgi:hypothetical protein